MQKSIAYGHMLLVKTNMLSAGHLFVETYFIATNQSNMYVDTVDLT